MTNGLSAPVVDVVIVTHNSGPLLAKCLEALLSSTISLGIWVVDNASSDGSEGVAAAILAKHSASGVIRNSANRGFATAVNQGVVVGRAAYVLLLNPDCVVAQDSVVRMVSALSEESSAGMAGCLILNTDGSEQVGCRRREPSLARALSRVMHRRQGAFDLTDSALPQTAQFVEAISGALMLVRRDAAEKVGWLDEGYFLHCEDLDWCYRFRQAGYSILFVPQVSVWHAKGGSSSRKPVFVEWHKHAGMIRYFAKFHRTRHSWLVWQLVRFGIWTRFLLKAAWLTARRLVGTWRDG